MRCAMRNLSQKLKVFLMLAIICLSPPLQTHTILACPDCSDEEVALAEAEDALRSAQKALCLAIANRVAARRRLAVAQSALDRATARVRKATWTLRGAKCVLVGCAIAVKRAVASKDPHAIAAAMFAATGAAIFAALAAQDVREKVEEANAAMTAVTLAEDELDTRQSWVETAQANVDTARANRAAAKAALEECLGG